MSKTNCWRCCDCGKIWAYPYIVPAGAILQCPDCGSFEQERYYDEDYDAYLFARHGDDLADEMRDEEF